MNTRINFSAGLSLSLGMTVAASMIAGAGCSSSSSSVDAAVATIDAKPVDANPLAPDANANLTALIGTWKTACAAPGSGGGIPGATHVQQAITFTSTTFSYTQSGFSDNLCATPVLVLAETGTFVLGGAATTPTGAENISFTENTNTATPSNGEAAMLNTANGGASICKTAGGSPITFTDGTAADLSGATCGGPNSNPQTTDGTTLSNIIEVVSGPGLEFGTGQNQSDELGVPSTGTVPTSLDTNTVFVKS